MKSYQRRNFVNRQLASGGWIIYLNLAETAIFYSFGLCNRNREIKQKFLYAAN